MLRGRRNALPFIVSHVHDLPGAGREFLDPAVAFRPRIKTIDAQTVEVSFDIASGYYLYREKFRFASESERIKIGTPVFPKGQVKNDENFGSVEVYSWPFACRSKRGADSSSSLALNVVLQGCAEAGVCAPPQNHALKVELPPLGGLPVSGGEPEDGGDESGKIAQALKHSGFFANLFFFFLAGLGCR